MTPDKFLDLAFGWMVNIFLVVFLGIMLYGILRAFWDNTKNP
jgi:hypothetical protein